ncbi:MAG TPA: amidohydrolase [Vicinamibacterales bacterium]|nr:amidohydrolase [Vicinamibacterales bacterium]
MTCRPCRFLAGWCLALSLAFAGCGTPPARETPGTSGDGTAPVSLIVANATVVTVDGASRVLNPGSIAIDGARIVAIDTPEIIAARFSSPEAIDLGGHIVLPGLINLHTHAPMVLYRGLADDLALMDWLQKYIFPAEAKTISPEFVRVGTRLAALEMIRSGTTLFADMYYFEEEVAAAVKESGMRGVLGQTIIEFPVADASTPARGLERAEAFVTRFKDDELVVPSVAPHSMYTLDTATLQAARALAVKYSVPLQIHLAETEEEVRISRERHRLRPVAFLESIGFWAPVTLAAHGIWVTPDEVTLLVSRGVGVSHNPESNMKLASGTAPVPAYLAAGAKLGLGTDGAASNNDLDMFEAMRAAALLHKLTTRDPRVVSAAQALAMATIGGARALGMDDRLGSLEPGKLADLIAIRTDHARQVPLYDPVSHIVYVAHGDDVVLTMVNGRVLYRDGVARTLDERRVIADARAAADQVRKAVQAP